VLITVQRDQLWQRILHGSTSILRSSLIFACSWIPFYRIMQKYGLSNDLWSMIAAENSTCLSALRSDQCDKGTQRAESRNVLGRSTTPACPPSGHSFHPALSVSPHPS
jgi:hypothetical protein